MGLPGTIDEPRPESFGVTAEDVELAPELFVTRFRLLIFFALYIAVFAAAFTIIYVYSNSIPAALTFGLIAVAAVSIVLIPLLMCVICASEKLETRWLCRRFPAIKACVAYREAMTEFRRLTRRSPEPIHDRQWWSRLSPPTFRGQVQEALQKRDLRLTPIVDRRADGYDFTIDEDGEKVLIRCEAGATPVDVGVGRELASCLEETGAERAILVSPAGVSPNLAAYLMDRPIDVVDPEQILANPPAEL
jgi:hypothetical protein